MCAAPIRRAFSDTAPNLHASYAACEAQHPEFSQPESLPPGEITNPIPEGPELDAATLAFAQCARAEGFTGVADPQGPWGGVGIPSSIAESEMRAMLAACIDPDTQILIDWQDGEPDFNVDNVTRAYRDSIAGFIANE